MTLRPGFGSAPRVDRAQAGQPSSRALAFVVADERIDRREVDRGGEMNCVQGAQGGLLKRAGGSEKRTIDWQESDGIQELSGSSQERRERKRGIDGCCALYRAGHLGERELTRKQVGIGEEGTKRIGLGLGAHQLHKCRGVEIEQRHAQR
jgi:hypothetical protein